jgi:hypothetical protein
MIFQITKGSNTYDIDDLKPFNQQTKALQQAFDEAEKQGDHACQIAEFANAQVSVYFSNRVIVTLKDIEDENI